MNIRIRQMVLLAALLAAPPAAAQQRELVGKIFHRGTNGEEIILKGVPVSMEPSGAATVSNNQGMFRLPLPAFLRPDDLVTLSIGKHDWRIRYPLDGEVRIPAEPLRHVEPVELLPVGSKLFWTHDRIEKFIADEIRKSAQRNAPKDDDPKIRFSRALRDWAERYGLSAVAAREEIERWVRETQKAATVDERRLGLAFYAEQQFEKAAVYFGRAAEASSAELEKLEQEESALAVRKKEEREAAIANFWDQGRAHEADWRFDAAIAAYEKALRHAARENDPPTWAALQNDLGTALARQGLRRGGAESLHQLNESIVAFRGALEVQTREALPEAWARTQNNLGTALKEEGVRRAGARSLRLLGEAVEAYRRALEVRTRERLPEAWAMTQNNLGTALQEQGIRSGGEAAVRLLTESISAYRSALEVYTREALPRSWAGTQNNLGTALMEQSRHRGGEEAIGLLGEAVAAHRGALEVQTPAELPQDWAMTQNNLGNALAEHGMRRDGEEAVHLLGEAIVAHRSALKVRTRADAPQDWAATQENLGNALSRLAAQRGGEESVRLLDEAVVAFRNALEVRTREELPQDWASTQSNLGVVLKELGLRRGGEEGARLLSESVQAYRRALEIFSREQMPGPFVMVRTNEGLALQQMGRHVEALRAFEEALEVEPDQPEWVHRLLVLHYEHLHDAGAALDLAERWLAKHPEDVWVTLHLPEWLFGNEDFAEARKWSEDLASVFADSIRIAGVLRAYTIAANLAQDQRAEGSAKLDRLMADVAAQKPDFTIAPSFEGTHHFVRNTNGLPHREALIALFEALQAPDRDAIVAGLARVKMLVASAHVDEKNSG